MQIQLLCMGWSRLGREEKRRRGRDEKKEGRGDWEKERKKRREGKRRLQEHLNAIVGGVSEWDSLSTILYFQIETCPHSLRDEEVKEEEKEEERIQKRSDCCAKWGIHCTVLI
jgi:hypothetical protein